MSEQNSGRATRVAEQLRQMSRLPLRVLLPTAAAIGGGGALAAASIPGSGGVITACYSTVPYDNSPIQVDSTATYTFPEYGQVRIIDPSAPTMTASNGLPAYNNSCVPGQEQTITWNQQGPQGPEGPQGPQGAQGAQGPQGAQGAAGSNGAASIDGAATFEIDAGGGTELLAKLAGIPGTTRVAGQGAVTPLSKLAFGAERAVIGNAREGAGAAIQTFELVKSTDRADGLLFNDWRLGRTIATLTVEAGRMQRSGFVTDAAYTFDGVKLKSITQRDGRETVIGVFRALKSSVGSGGSKVNTKLNPGSTITWDLSTTKLG